MSYVNDLVLIRYLFVEVIRVHITRIYFIISKHSSPYCIGFVDKASLIDLRLFVVKFVSSSTSSYHVHLDLSGNLFRSGSTGAGSRMLLVPARCWR
jgi:hypothetical protein